MINIGVIGVGYIGPIHVNALSRIGGVRVKALADAAVDRAKSVAADLNVADVYEDYRKLLADPEIDVIHNCTPNKFHYEINKEAIEAGKHVLSEKPLAMTLDEAAELVQLATKAGTITGINFCYRYYPVVQEMAVKIRRGDLGKVRMVTGSYLQDWLSNETDYSWRLDGKESGASNITADLGSHWFDLVQFATGLRVTEVMADFATLIPVRKRPKDATIAFAEAGDVEYEEVKIELEDYSALLFKLSNGAPGSFTTSQVCAGRKSDTEFQIYGDKASYAWNHKHATELWMGHREKPNETLIENPILQDESTSKYANLPAGHPLGYHDAEVNLFTDYYDAVQSKEADDPEKRPTFLTGYDEMKILAAAVSSNTARRWTTVEW